MNDGLRALLDLCCPSALAGLVVVGIPIYFSWKKSRTPASPRPPEKPLLDPDPLVRAVFRSLVALAVDEKRPLTVRDVENAMKGLDVATKKKVYDTLPLVLRGRPPKPSSLFVIEVVDRDEQPLDISYVYETALLPEQSKERDRRIGLMAVRLHLLPQASRLV